MSANTAAGVLFGNACVLIVSAPSADVSGTAANTLNNCLLARRGRLSRLRHYRDRQLTLRVRLLREISRALRVLERHSRSAA